MPRRAGKAASRRARQRQVRRPAAPPAPRPAEPVPPVGTPDAREAASLTPPRRTVPAGPVSTGSRLNERERAEYHYVERDLRDIGILTALMAILLLAAWFAFRALGLVG